MAFAHAGTLPDLVFKGGTIHTPGDGSPGIKTPGSGRDVLIKETLITVEGAFGDGGLNIG